MRPKHGCEDNITTDLKEISVMVSVGFKLLRTGSNGKLL
jgi:hypothetical protein